jgi:hypothetical protein
LGLVRLMEREQTHRCTFESCLPSVLVVLLTHWASLPLAENGGRNTVPQSCGGK